MTTVRRILRSIATFLTMAMLLVSLSTAASAHKEHKKKKPVAAHVVQQETQLARPSAGAVRAQIEKTKAEQQKEIDHIEDMLSGKLPATAEAVPAKPEATATEKTPAAKPASAKPAPAKPRAAETKPAEPKAPTPDCSPEHRAAGHC